MPEGMAADRHRNGEARDVRRAPFNVHGKCGCRAAKLRSDARLVDHLEELTLEFCILGHRMTLVDRTRKCLLREECRLIHCAADPDTDHLRRTRIRACVLDDLHDRLFHTLHAVRRNKHLDAGLVFRTEALRRNRDAELVARNDLRVDDSRRVVLRVLAVKERLRDNRLAQIPLRIALGNALVDGILKETA